jgi:hypothetical protein
MEFTARDSNVRKERERKMLRTILMDLCREPDIISETRKGRLQ